MAKAVAVAIVAIIFAGTAGMAYCTAEEYRLYTPQLAEGTELPTTSEEGILVKIITIQRGDTLIALSRKFFGRGQFYPEFLPFNEISNPNLIYAGAKLSVPLRNSSGTAKPYKVDKKQKAVRQAIVHASQKEAKATKHVTIPPSAQINSTVEMAEDVEFERAVNLYKQGKYEQALSVLDDFLERYPVSILAADATLYRGDCYIHLSGF